MTLEEITDSITDLVPDLKLSMRNEAAFRSILEELLRLKEIEVEYEKMVAEAKWEEIIPNRKKILKRFNSKVKVDVKTGCHVWTAGTSPKGYGYFSFNQKCHMAHRVSYMLQVGPIPEGLHILHSCDNPFCVNPAHLRAGTNQENMDDRNERTYTNLKKSCPKCEDPYYVGPNGKRYCKTCRSKYVRSRNLLNRDKINAKRRLKYKIQKAGV